MKISIYSFALIKAIYDQGEDYIDSFVPFIVKVFPEQTKQDCRFIQKEIEKQHNIKIPRHVLEIIMKRAKRKGFFKQDNNNFYLDDKGIQFKDSFETDKDVQRRINSLIKDIQEFFNTKSNVINDNDIEKILQSFIAQNIEPMIDFFNPNADKPELKISTTKNQERILLEYIKSAEESKPEYFSTIKDMFNGSLISTVLYVPKASQLDEIKSMKFDHCDLFLDTNFIFSLLGLHEHSFNEAAKELLTILKDYKFRLKVFDFTIDEISRVIKGFFIHGYKYPTTIPVDSLYSSLKRLGWHKSDAINFIADVETRLEKNGIEIKLTDIELDKVEYEEDNENLYSTFISYKPEQSDFHRNHDISALIHIRNSRGTKIRKIEKANCLFITSDYRLAKLNYFEFGHKANGTVSEVIADRLLTNILWLKKPSADFNLKSIIAAHSRSLFVQRRVWEAFYNIIKGLNEEKKVTNEEISSLFYGNYIEDTLLNIDEDNIREITPEFIISEIEKATTFKEEQQKKILKDKETKLGIAFEQEKEQILKEKDEQFEIILEEEKTKIETIKNQEIIDHIAKTRRSLKKSAKKSGNRLSIFISGVISIVFLILLIFVYNIGKNYLDKEIVVLILGFLLSGGGLITLWTSIRKKINEYISNMRYNQLVKAADLKEGINK